MSRAKLLLAVLVLAGVGSVHAEEIGNVETHEIQGKTPGQSSPSPSISLAEAVNFFKGNCGQYQFELKTGEVATLAISSGFGNQSVPASEVWAVSGPAVTSTTALITTRLYTLITPERTLRLSHTLQNTHGVGNPPPAFELVVGNDRIGCDQ